MDLQVLGSLRLPNLIVELLPLVLLPEKLIEKGAQCCSQNAAVWQGAGGCEAGDW